MKYIWIKPMVIGLSFIGLLGQTTQAQKLYLDFNVGYGLPVSGSTMLISESSSIQDGVNGTYTNTEKIVPLSLGQGFNFGVNMGFLFHENIGFDLGLNYQIGSKTTGTNKNIWYNGRPSPETYSYSTTYSSNMLYITPSLLLKTNLGKFSPYSKLGLAMGVGKINNASDENDRSGDQLKSTTEYSGGMAWGFEMSLGGAYTFNEKLSLYAEAYYRNMSYAPKKSVITSSSRNGEDILDQMNTSNKEVEYFKEVTEENSAYDPDSPRKASLINFPYHSLGLKLGLRINL